MKHRFTRIHRQFGPGDLVPANYDAGTIDAMLKRGIIAPVEEKMAVDAPNKAILSSAGKGNRRNK